MKIILTGPASTGKSTLAKQLAEHYQVDWVEEYARTYIQTLNRLYEEADLVKIAVGQQQRITEKEMKNPPLLFCDTSFLVIKIWAEYKYERCDEDILKLLQEQEVDLYLLCGTDVPWEADPQRENPNKRKELYQIYKSELKELRVPFVELQGNKKERLKKAIVLIDSIFSGMKKEIPNAK